MRSAIQYCIRNIVFVVSQIPKLVVYNTDITCMCSVVSDTDKSGRNNLKKSATIKCLHLNS